MHFGNHHSPAFARPTSANVGYTEPGDMGINTMTYFTAAAMQGLAANPSLTEYSIKELGEMAADLAYQTITAMNNYKAPAP
jgi:uncharacterized protein (DUF1810 family)